MPKNLFDRVLVIQQKWIAFEKKLLIIGFGSIGQAVLPLLFRHIELKPEQVTIITKNDDAKEITMAYGVHFIVEAITRENYVALLKKNLQQGDFLLNLSIDVSSAALVELCQDMGVLYLDTCIEPWAGGYVDGSLSPTLRSNYAMRNAILALRNQNKTTTAVLAHGANPGLVSHFVKQALMNIAADTGLAITTPKTQTEWATLACQLGIKTIHIAERDTQATKEVKRRDEFVNTWSVDGFVAEGLQPAELGWGTHEKHFPRDAYHHEEGPQCAIYLNRPGAKTRVRTWTPNAGAFHAFLITHTEAISISHYFTLKMGESLHYRPTVHFAYHPCADAVLSLQELMGKEWQPQQQKRILFNEIIDGMDELGVLLMGHKKGAYWFGSQLTIQKARELAPHNNATSLQVAAGALAGVVWTIAHPTHGIVEPDEMDHVSIMKMAEMYLGNVCGHYTDWTPLKERTTLFPEKIDSSDPWQFINVRVE